MDMSDLIILSTNWLQVASTYDIAPVGGDGIVDLLEFQVLSEEWFR